MDDKLLKTCEEDSVEPIPNVSDLSNVLGYPNEKDADGMINHSVKNASQSKLRKRMDLAISQSYMTKNVKININT